MKIQKMDMFHGAALTQIVEHPSFKALNKADEKYGHYQINHDRRISIKYRDANRSPWTFTLTSDDIRMINDDLRRKDGRTFLCLVCGKVSVCHLHEGDIDDLIDLNTADTQWIRVEIPSGGSMHIKGSKGKLKREPSLTKTSLLIFSNKGPTSGWSVFFCPRRSKNPLTRVVERNRFAEEE